MIAKTTDQGTAASETALCDVHDTPENRAKVEALADADVTGPWVDATGNDELSCVAGGPAMNVKLCGYCHLFPAKWPTKAPLLCDQCLERARREFTK